MLTFLYFFTITVFLLLCVLLCTVILMQESKSTGLGSSFGGDASESVFGTATADILKKFTSWLSVVFFISCIVLSMWTSALGRAHAPAETQDYTIEQPQG